MSRLASEEDKDLYLEEALRRIKRADYDSTRDNPQILEEEMQNFSKNRVKAFVAISGLKDSVSKKQELIQIIEDLSISFYALGVNCGTARLERSLDDRMIHLETKLDKASHGPTYADTAKIGAKVHAPFGRAVVPAPKKAIIVTPIRNEDGKKTCDDTKRALLGKVKPGDLGIKADRLLKSGKAGIRIEAKEINVDQVNHAALERAGLKMEVLGKWKPRMAIFGVPSDVEAEVLKEEILNSLGEEAREEVNVKSKFGPREKHFQHWVIEVTPNTRKEMLARERIYIGWSSCVVKDHIRVLRCFKCQKFGHLQKDCKGDLACGHCAGEHDTRKCKGLNKPPKCYNCSKAGHREDEHEARSAKCHMYIKRTKDIISNTDYGQ